MFSPDPRTLSRLVRESVAAATPAGVIVTYKRDGDPEYDGPDLTDYTIKNL